MAGLTPLAKDPGRLERVTSELEEMKKQHHQLLMRTPNCSCSIVNGKLKEKPERITSELEKMNQQHQWQRVRTNKIGGACI